MGLFTKGDEAIKAEKAIDAVLDELETLPQFIAVGGKLLNGITGCVVSREGEDLLLNWVETYAGSDGRRARLCSGDKVSKFLQLMKLQANALGTATSI